MPDNGGMATAFENIIAGVWPGRFEWADDVCVAFSTIEPIAPGHVLVVPRHPWAKWTDAPAEAVAHLMTVARTIGVAQERAFGVPRSGLIVAGFEVPHAHIHVVPLRSEADVLLSRARSASEEELDAAARALRAALVEDGQGAHVPAEMGSPALA